MGLGETTMSAHNSGNLSIGRRTALRLAGASALAIAAGSHSIFAADKLKVAAVFGTPIEEPWVNQVHVALLKANPLLKEWHFFGMEWKEHVAWFPPISITMVAALFLRYGRNLRQFPSKASALWWRLSWLT